MESAFWKTILFIALLASCVFLGVELASSGIERVYGPGFGGGMTAQTEAWTQEAAEAKEEPAADETKFAAADFAEPAAALPAEPDAGSGERTSLVNAVSFWIGDVLRYVARGIIRFVTDVFSAIVQ